MVTETFSIEAPPVGRHQFINLVPQICYVGKPCEWKFEFGDELLEMKPLILFKLAVPSEWSIFRADYCKFVQIGSFIGIQIIQPKKFFSDDIAHCTFSVKSSTTNLDPEKIALELFQTQTDEQYTQILSSIEPLPIFNNDIYTPHNTISSWVVNNLPTYPPSTPISTATTLIQNSPIVDIVPELSCIGSSYCNINYTFKQNGIIRTIKFVNFFRVVSTLTLPCLDSSNTPIAHLTFSPSFEFAYLRSISIEGFLQQSCTISYPISGINESRKVLHQYEYSSRLYQPDPELAIYTELNLSDEFPLPTFSPISFIVKNSLIQPHSDKNFLTLEISKNNSPQIDKFDLIGIDVILMSTTNGSPVPTTGRFALNQFDCIISLDHDVLIPPECSILPTPNGFKITLLSSNSQNTKYITITWRMGAGSTLSTSTSSTTNPYLTPSILAVANLQYEYREDYDQNAPIKLHQFIADSTNSITPHANLISALAVPFIPLQLGGNYEPLVWHSDASTAPLTATEQSPLYLQSLPPVQFDQTGNGVNIKVKIDTPIPKGAHLIFQLSYIETSGVLIALDLEIKSALHPSLTLIDPSTGLIAPTCTFCTVFLVSNTIDDMITLGTMSFELRYRDQFNSYSRPTLQSCLRIKIKTPLSPLSNLPPPYQPLDISTIFNWPTPIQIVTYNYALISQNIVSQRSLLSVTSVILDETILFRLPPLSEFDSILSNGVALNVPEVFRNDFKDVSYTYRFDECWAWKPANQQCTVVNDGLTCTPAAPDSTAANANNRKPMFEFLFKPDRTWSRSYCTMNISIQGLVRLGRKNQNQYKAFTWNFLQTITTPSILRKNTVAFPREAIPCYNPDEPVLALAGPGIYAITAPHEFYFPEQTTPEYSLSVAKANEKFIFTFTVGSLYVVPTDEDLYRVTLVSTSMECPQHQLDITKLRWSYSYQPLPSMTTTTTRTLIADIGFYPKLGYYITHNDKMLPQNDKTVCQIYVPNQAIASVDPYQTTPFRFRYYLFSSISKESVLKLSPPPSYNYQILLPAAQKSQFPYYFDTWAFNKDNQPNAYRRRVDVRITSDEFNPASINYHYDNDVDIYSPTRSYLNVTMLPTNEDVNIGGYVNLYSLSPFNGNMYLSQCAGAICADITSVAFQIVPPAQATFDFYPQLSQDSRSSIVINRDFHIGDVILIPFISIKPGDLSIAPTVGIPYDLEIIPNTYLYDTHVVSTWVDYEYPIGKDIFWKKDTNDKQLNPIWKGIRIDIQRYIPISTKLQFECEIVGGSISTLFSTVNRSFYPLLAILRTPLTSSTSMMEEISYSSTFGTGGLKQFVSMIQKYLTEPLPQNIPIKQLDISTPVRSFTLLNGFHLSSSISFTINLDRIFTIGQSIQFSELPLGVLINSVIVTPEGHTFSLKLSQNDIKTAGYSRLILTSNTPYTIPTNSPITITLPTMLTLPTNAPGVISELSCSSTGLGIHTEPFNKMILLTNIPILQPYLLSVTPQSYPLTLSEPYPWTVNRLDDNITCVLNGLCFIKILFSQLSSTNPDESSPLLIPPTGLTVVVLFSSPGIDTDASYNLLNGSFSLTEPETYYASDTATTTPIFTATREFKLVGSKVTSVTFKLTPINTAIDTLLTQLTFPAIFTKDQLRGSIRVIINTNSTPPMALFNQIIPGPLVFPQDISPRFFYIRGGAYVMEQLAIGVTGLGLIEGTTPPALFETVQQLPPLPRFVQGSYSWPLPQDPGATWDSLGVYDSSTTGQALSKLFRAFKPVEDPSRDFFGAVIFEKFLTEQSVKLNFHPFSPLSQTDTLSMSFENIGAIKAIDFGSTDPTSWSFSTYSNRHVNNQAPFNTYDQLHEITTKKTTGFRIRPQPWLRIIPNLPSIDFNEDLSDDPEPYTPLQQYLVLNIIQNWPKREEIDEDVVTFPQDWEEFRLQAYDIVQFTIPDYYNVPVGVYSCTDPNSHMEWNGLFFLLHSGTETSHKTPDQYTCTFPISVSRKSFENYLANNTPDGIPTAEITKSKTCVSTLNQNVDFHLPTTDSDQISPLRIDTSVNNLTPVKQLYFEWYMPAPISLPRYDLQFQDVDTVGIPRKLRLTITNGYLSATGSLTYPFETFPVPISSTETVGAHCIDARGTTIARVLYSDLIGLQFTFLQQFSLKILQCWVDFTPSLPLYHGGKSINIQGILITNPAGNGNTLVDTTVQFTSKISHPLQIRPRTPTVTISGTVIKGLTARITITGTEFSFEQPSVVDINGVPTSINSTLSISIGVPFTAGWGHSITDITGLSCVTLSNEILADVTFSFVGQSTATTAPLQRPPGGSLSDIDYASADGMAGIANRFTLTLAQGVIRPEQQWSCSFDVIPIEDTRVRIPDALFRIGPSSTNILLKNELISRERVEIDLGFVQSSRVTNRISSFTFYYNATSLYTIDDSDAPELTISLPLPLSSFPHQEGVLCKLNNDPSILLPLRIKSISSVNSFYTIPLERYIVPTGKELNRLRCTIPNLATKSQFGTTRARFRIGANIFSTFFETNNIPNMILQTSSGTQLKVGSSKIPLFANKPQVLSFNMTNFEMIQPLMLISSSENWSIKSEIACTTKISTPDSILQPNETILFNSIYGMVTVRQTTQATCYQVVTAVWTGKIQPRTTVVDCVPGFATTCYHSSAAFLSLPHGATQLYPVEIAFSPYIVKKDYFDPHCIGTPGVVNFSFTNFAQNTAFVVRMTAPPTFPFEGEISIIDSNGVIIQNSIVSHRLGVYYNPDEISTTYDFSVVYPNRAQFWSETDRGVLYSLSNTDNRWDTTKTLRISYRAASESVLNGRITIHIFSATANDLALNPDLKNWFTTDRTIIASHITPVISLLPPSYHDKIAIPTWSSLLQLKPWNPFVSITPPLTPIRRGIVQNFGLTISNISPLIKGLNGIPIASFMTSSDTTLDHLSSDWHLSSPYGNTYIPTDTGSITATSSVCFDHRFNSSIPLATLVFIVVPDNDLAPTMATIMTNIIINFAAIPPYLSWLRTDAAFGHPSRDIEIMSCEFPLAFTAPSELSYIPPQSNPLNQQWIQLPLIGFDAFGGLTPGYLSRNYAFSYFFDFPEIPNQFVQNGRIIATLDQSSHTMSQIGTITFTAEALQLVPGDVILVKFLTNTTDASKSITNPFDQPYLFSAPTDGSNSGVCYNVFYPTAQEAAGTLVAASGYNYREQLGGASNTFILRILKGSKGLFPQFTCTAAFTPMSLLPFKGLIEIQHFTAREYDILTQKITFPGELGLIDPIYPNCTGELASHEQIRWCPLLVGRISDPVKLGVNVAVTYDNVPEPLSPISITFVINVSPTRQNALLIADFSKIRFAAFYGCPGYPDASFYGKLGTDEGSDYLHIYLPEVSSDATITCHFLSSRYIQPIYQGRSDLDRLSPSQIIKRPGVDIPFTLSLPDPYNNFQQAVVYQSSFNFKSTYDFPHHSISVDIIFDRTTLVNQRASSSNKIAKYTADPYLSQTERTSLISWLQQHIAPSVLPIVQGGAVALFTHIDIDSIFILGQDFSPDESLLTVHIAFPSVSIARVDSLYARTFETPKAWIDSGRTEGLSLHSSKMLLRFMTFNQIGNYLEEIGAINDKYIPLKMFTDIYGLFDSCLAGACGGSCEPCVDDDPCFISQDCRYGLYCYIQTTTGIATTADKHEQLIIKPGLTQAPGVCKPLGFGFRTYQEQIEAQVVAYNVDMD